MKTASVYKVKEIFEFDIFRIFLGELKGLICNKSARKVCCKDETLSKADTVSQLLQTKSASVIEIDRASQLYLPNATRLECGFSSNAEFIVGKAGLSTFRYLSCNQYTK